MTATVRIFSHSEIVTAPVAASSGRYSSDSVGLLKQPYLGRESLDVTSTAAQTSAAATAANGTKLLHVLVQPGKTVFYEITPSGQTVTVATSSSKFMSGSELFQFGPGWQISLLEYIVV